MKVFALILFLIGIAWIAFFALLIGPELGLGKVVALGGFFFFKWGSSCWRDEDGWRDGDEPF